MKLLNWIPGSFVTKAAIVGLIYVLGITTGQLIENRRLIERKAEESANTMRENHLILFAEFKRRNAEYKKHIEQQQGADAAAYAVLEKGRADAVRSAEQARASLRIALGEAAKLRENVDGLKNVNGMLADAARNPDPLCVLDGGVRSILDYASGAADSPGPGIAEAEAASIPVTATGESATAPDRLTCDQLARGYVSLSVWGRRGWSLYDSWRVWSDKALR